MLKSARVAFAAIVLLGTTLSFAQGPGPSVHEIPRSSLTVGPAPTNGVPDASSINDYLRLTPANAAYPLMSEFGSGRVTTETGLSVGIAVPGQSTIYQAQAIAGYISNGSTRTVGAAVLGQATMTAAGTQIDGVNCLTTNSPHQENGARTGFDGPGNLPCFEASMNLNTLPGGTAPRINAWGLLLGGLSTSKPAAPYAFDAIHVGAMPVSWNFGIKTDAGAADVGASFGPVLRTGESGSQPIRLGAVDKVGHALTGSAALNSAGAIVLQVGKADASLAVTDGTGSIFEGNKHGSTLPGTVRVGSIEAAEDITAGYFKLTPRTFAVVTRQRPCNAANAGTFAFISDSTTTVLNAIVSGHGTHPATIVCSPDGSNYIVVGG